MQSLSKISQNKFSPFGVTLTNRNYTSSNYRYGFNGMEKDDEVKGIINSYDYGARIYDNRLGRFLSTDNFQSKFPNISSYCFAQNTPIVGRDVNGDSLYILTVVSGYSRGDDMFEAAADTRKFDIENSWAFDPLRDKVVIITVQDVSEIEEKVEKTVAENSDTYGTTSEFGVYSHAGYDGPSGSVDALKNPLEQGSSQMSIEGWGEIDFNWSDNGARAYFYGCNTGVKPNQGASFVTNLSTQTNMKDVAVFGQTGSAYPSQYTNERSTTLEQGIDEKFLPVETTHYYELLPLTGIKIGVYDIDKTYMVGGNGGKLEAGKAMTVGTTALPMRKAVNGVGEVKDNQYQAGDKND
jgi:RHS repeat-associated protein